MEIPKSFKLYGQTIKVSDDPNLFHRNNLHGQACYRTSSIILQPKTDSIDISVESYEQAFCHELMHFILYEGGEDQFDPPLNSREYLVDRLASLLHQAFQTMEFN